MSKEKREQVAAQCRAVAHMATALAQIHADYAGMVEPGDMDKMLDTIGRRTASFMEQLGNMLNAMDACTEEDNWLTPIFKEAQRLWPAAAAPDATREAE